MLRSNANYTARNTNVGQIIVIGDIFGRFANFDKCRPEVADDVISGANVGFVGMDVPVKFVDSSSNGS